MKKLAKIFVVIGGLILLTGPVDTFAQWNADEGDTTETQKRDRLLEEYLRKQEDQSRQATSYESMHKLMEDDQRLPQPEYPAGRIYDDSLYYPWALEDTLPDTLPVPTAAEDTLPDTLLPFGYDLFRVPPSLALPSDVSDISDYILGPGDNILIYLWGKVEKEYNLYISRQGKVFIPRVGEVVAWGMNLDEFTTAVKKRLSKAYTDFNVSVSLGKIRSIRVYLTGEVKKPGAYTVSSLATLFNAMYLAGGPTDRGSMRIVRLIRGGREVGTVDLYEFLLRGESRGDMRLSSGDAVFVAVTGPRVAIDGEVMRPAIYELKEGETVGDILELAGGPTATAYLDRIMLERISDNGERVVLDLNLNPDRGEKIDDIELKNGDAVTLYSIFDITRRVVSVGGMVKHPQRFERADSATLRDLILRAELPPANVYYERANLFRQFPDQRQEIIPVNITAVLNGVGDILLQDLDSLHVYSIDEIERKMYVYIDGEVKRPGRYRLYDNMSLGDLIFLSGDLKKNAYHLNIELARTDYQGKVTVQRFNRDDARVDRTVLREDDHVFVREIPNLFLHQMVTIEGDVKFPGRYALLSRKETLYDLITRAGGFTAKAFPKGIIFQRQSIGEALIRQNLPEIIANSQPIKEDSLGNIRKLEFIKFNAENVNRIIIDIEKLVSSSGDVGDIRLQNGDYIYVPEIPSGISVMGAVGAEGTIKFERGKKVKYYIARAGNLSRQADKGAVKLIKADGRVFAGSASLRRKVELGDAIVVPTEIHRDRDWLKTISAITSLIGGIMTTVFVIDKL